MTNRLVTWSGIDEATRIDQASIELNATSMLAIGIVRAQHFVSSWELDVSTGWITRALRVTTRGFGWARSLELTRSDEGTWSAESDAWGDNDLALPGLTDPDSLSGAIDCDLGLCPVTNTMPIRRLGLLEQDVNETPLIMAWVEIPSLRVLRSDQVYASGPASDRNRIPYKSFNRDFSAHLTVDVDGLVIDYPTLAHRA
ncbi:MULTISPECIES: putative glycolipid-binding domain-containing protein [Cryobacterium]|uniref:Glycolipid-binding domain-containing protein n=1 Tax=Cryobacterium breve TaxID=1259258 RepID=A0ABY2J3W6_9MICO|nr:MULTISPECIES: putative glycolipid-binding domain-containing protein [Cryobacterium]TFC92509.1 hypothetical protein E3T20_11805 [Cryobacterium sp. TmT3-12]TFC99625.1 hypothetical protein E3O65_05760 [Cryobacterium breve]